MADPPVPPDGSCATCGKPRRIDGVKPLYQEAARTDPFCSTVCARAWYGIPLPATPHRGRVAYVESRRRAD